MAKLYGQIGGVDCELKTSIIHVEGISLDILALCWVDLGECKLHGKISFCPFTEHLCPLVHINVHKVRNCFHCCTVPRAEEDICPAYLLLQSLACLMVLFLFVL
eukprot:TRINITY_DN107056_c0_g1_i1.p1 TRINITY_DN107056_c0_g1~~TRINITY_DN107056_c0_g1_i1.p1  ORF type:complete len:104 (+),score=12.77 TRINITY_DN107056_c0_g1_i1:123-434(+)